MSKLLDDVCSELQRLPGIGRRTALRLAMHMLKMETEMDCRAVKRMFVEIAGYKDSMERAKKCREVELHIQSGKVFLNEEKKNQLLQEKQALEQEMEGLSKLFGGKRRKEIEVRLEEIEELLS